MASHSNVKFEGVCDHPLVVARRVTVVGEDGVGDEAGELLVRGEMAGSGNCLG